MPLRDALRQCAEATDGRARPCLYGVKESIELGELASRSVLDVAPETLRGRSILLATVDQLPAALALLELDGTARRIVLQPPDVAAEYLPGIIAAAEIDAVVTDPGRLVPGAADIAHFAASRPRSAPFAVPQRTNEATEWVLLTSGTTGAPKLVVHTLRTLIGAIAAAPAEPGTVWSTFYDIRRYGGLQIFLRTILGGGSLVLSSAGEPVGAYLARAARCGVTHISGTPSHWRHAVMSAAIQKITPHYVRLSGEIADQAVLDYLQKSYPRAQVAHAFASTEAGVAFEVRDGLAGFPANLVDRGGGGVELRVTDGSLRIRSNRTAFGYLRATLSPLTDPEGFVDTGDMVERHGERYRFAGRRDGVINVGGQKIHPEEVEAVINSHPAVRWSRVRARSNPIVGSIVVADVISCAVGGDEQSIAREIMNGCRHILARHKVPAVIRFVPSLEVAASGKLARHHA